MIDLLDIRYVRLGTKDLESTLEYAQKILGLQVAREANGHTYLRSDHRDHTIAYYEGDPADQTVGFEIKSLAAFEEAANDLDNANFEVIAGTKEMCEIRRSEKMLAFKDPNGNQIELVWRPLNNSGRNYVPSRDAGITDFSHVGLYSSDPVRDEAFWTGMCSAKVSDWIGDAPLLRIDEIHHKLALFPAQKVGIQHINHQVESFDDIMRAFYFLTENNIEIVFGPGRHPTSGAIFLYFKGPDGMIYEYSTGVCKITDEENHMPRQFPFSPEGFCMWGSKPNIPEFKS